MDKNIFEIKYSYDDSEMWFRQERDSNGLLISQEQRVSRWNGDLVYNYSFKPIQREHKDEWLYHVTANRNIPEIKKLGLIPKIGNCYANHWMSFMHDTDNKLREKLYPGVFLLSGKRVSGGRRAGYKTCKVNVNDLDSRLLFADDAWENEQSLFYIGTIPPEKIQFIR